ncbi:MAG: acylphosphatase [Vicinamibacterales bacterium]
MRVTRQYLISGRVQGVGFRWFTADAAAREGLAGYVRNLPDGRVEAVAEGEVESLRRFEAALWRGPARAHVEDVRSGDTEPFGLAAGFSIR